MYEGNDDITLPLRATIVGWKTVGSHVEYVIDLEKILGRKKNHRVQKRYTEFSILSKKIERFGINLGLPPKKIFGNLKEEFIEQRKVALQKKFFSKTFEAKIQQTFSGPPQELISSPIDSLGSVHIELKEWLLLSLRSHPEWMINQHRPNIGWRAEKQFFEVNSGKKLFVLAGIRYGPDRCATMEQLNNALDFIRTIHNPHLNECIASWADNKGIIYVRPAFSGGTLRDRLYKSDWRDDFYIKYNIELSVCSLQLTDVRYICRHVLEALLILCALSIPYLDLHSGNILVTDEGCELLDVDQVLAGQPSFHRPCMLKSMDVNSIEDMMVFSFGEFLFELLTNFSLPMDSLKEEIDLVPVQFRPLLSSIFLPINHKLPSLFEIAKSDLFVDIPVAKMNRREMRMPSNVKTTFDALCNQVFERFQTDRSQLNGMEKEQKLRKLISSDSEKQRRRQIIRSEMKLNRAKQGRSVAADGFEAAAAVEQNGTNIRP